MARSITKRTLLGYRKGKINAHAFDDLIMQLRDKPEQFREKVSRGNFWNKEEREMKFDAIVGNPPYQIMDGGYGVSATPIYNLFVNESKKLSPDYLSMIMPSRWFTGGKYLDEFRASMLQDKRMVSIVDYNNFRDVFPGVDLAGGVCYFLWDKNHSGLCNVKNASEKMNVAVLRDLSEFEVFIRNNQALNIVKKVLASEKSDKMLSDIVSARKPFSLPTNYKPLDKGIPCWFIQKIGKKYASEKDITDTKKYLNKWKFLIPKSPIAGQTDFSKPVGFYYDGNTIIAQPGECCTESYIVAGAFDTKEEVLSYKSYIFTKVVRFLLLQTVVSQDVTQKNFIFIPDLGKYEGVYTDEILCKRWNITDEEWQYINSKIHNYNK